MIWELQILTTFTFSILSIWIFYSPQSRPRQSRYSVIYYLVCGIITLAYSDKHRLTDRLYFALHDATYDFRLNAFLSQYFIMALVAGAVFWLLRRSVQTLATPVPDLISILGVDIPESPDVSLAGIRADAATLSWTRPSSNRPVQKYSIQVNGVHVGDSPGNEVAITVTGLKPNHFYNIRVVAVGPNNFQAGSPVVRLRTFGKDGRPQLGNARLPTSFTDQEHALNEPAGESDDPDAPTTALPSIEAAPVLEGSNPVNRDATNAVTSQRRNTINRRNSPLVAASDQPQLKSSASDEPEMSLSELNEKFEGIRKEIEDSLALYAKDETESQQQDEDLKKERDRKRQALKEKEEQTTQLRTMIRTTMEQMRAAEKEKGKKEQQLKEKETKKSKVQENITRLEQERARMKKEKEGFTAQRKSLEEKRNSDVQHLVDGNADLQEKCTQLEAELKDKGKQLQDLKATREQLPGADERQFKEDDMRARREWEIRRTGLHDQLVAETKQGHQLDRQYRAVTEQIGVDQTTLTTINQQGSSAMEFDQSQLYHPRRHSMNSSPLPGPTIPSPGQLTMAEPNFQTPAAFNTGFVSTLFMDLGADENAGPQTEADLKAAGGPLSPSAQTLLPSNIFEENEDTDIRSKQNARLPEAVDTEADPQSPASSSLSVHMFSSPRGSTHNLPVSQYDENAETYPLSLSPSPTVPTTTAHRLSNFLSFGRTPRPADDTIGPPIGTLKGGQSQSFPRGTDESEMIEGRRKMGFPWTNRNSTGQDGASANILASPKPSMARRLNLVNSNGSPLYPDRDGEGSRPASIASSDLPRPSTDSGSIWNLPSDIAGLNKNRGWPQSDAHWPSRNGSRRPSLHGSTHAPTTSLASPDDEILDKQELLNPQTSPSQVGVIGSRLPRHSKFMSQRLNPNAPTFMGNIFRKDKDKEAGPDRERAKGKDKERVKDKSIREEKIRAKGSATPSIELTPSLDDSPSDSRMSRDTYSVHTQTSVTESHESLQLDSSVSNAPSDVTSNAASAAKDSENVVRKLFRKGSSSKFSLSSRLGKESALFKKGPGSATASSDKNMSAEQRSSIGDADDLGEDVTQLGRSYDSMASSPSIGPSKSKDSKESRIASWRFSMKKKGKEKDALETDQAPDEE